jgi:hypothetical protein
MPWNFILPALISMISGGVQAGTAGRQAELANQRAAQGAAERRRRLDEVMRRIRSTDYSHLDRAASREFSGSADQIEAFTAGRGTFRSGQTGARAMQTQAFSQALASLAAQKTQDQLARDNMVGQISADPAYGVPDPMQFNPGQAGLQAGLGGAMGGLGGALAAFLSSEAGASWLTSLGNAKAPPQTQATMLTDPAGANPMAFQQNQIAPVVTPMGSRFGAQVPMFNAVHSYLPKIGSIRATNGLYPETR